MVKTNYAKAYTEVLQILKHLPKDEFNKIPREKIMFYEENSDKTHKFKYDPKKELYNQEVLRETNVIIVKLYNDYFANETQKQTLKKILNEILSNFTSHYSEINEIIALKNKSYFSKLIDKIKSFFGK